MSSFTLVLVLAAAMLFSARSSSEAQPIVARSWPPFTMVYSQWEIDPVTGVLMRDHTVRFEAQDSTNYRAEVLSDRVKPSEAGSFTELRDGVLTTYNATYRNPSRQDVGRGVIVPIIPELSPNALGDLRRGRGPVPEDGWVSATPSQPGRIAFEQQKTLPCIATRTPAPPLPITPPPPPPGITRQQVVPVGPQACTGGPSGVSATWHIEFDPRNSRPTYDAGIAIFSERRINGVVVARFEAASLDIRWPAKTATPAGPIPR